MARRSLRTTSSVATTPRQQSTKATPTSKSSKRGRATPIKSPYFKPKQETRDAFLEATPTPSVEEDDEASGYEDEDVSALEPSSDDEEEEDDYSHASPPPKKKQRRGGAAKTTSKPTNPTSEATHSTSNGAGNAAELWREGVQTGLGHGTQVVIKKPKPRAAGKIPYHDATIHPNTMLFLSELAENNDRQWLKMHDPDFRTSWKDFESFLECCQHRLVNADPTIPELPLKDIVFRIYRDVRFSKDPTPYKPYFSAAWSRTGRKGPYAGYYLQVKPGGGSFVGAGYWNPEAAHVAKLRRDIDRHPDKLKRVLLDPGLRKHHMGGVAANTEKAVSAFVSQNQGNALKTCPKGFDRDHKDIGLLRLKNFVLGCKIDDEEVTLDKLSELLAALVPLVTYLNSVVMPDNDDPDSSDSSSSDN